MHSETKSEGTQGMGAGGSGAGAAAHAPKLRSGAQYAQWVGPMDVFLERFGANGVHTRVLTPKQWKEYQSNVKLWSEAAFDEAAALLFGPPSAASGSSSSSSSNSGQLVKNEPDSGVNPEVKAARKVITQHVENSIRVYGVIYSTLPEELRPQVETAIASGCAYALWKWLEEKFQSTEQDSVGELLSQWVGLVMNEDELYDAFRARVDKLKSLLTLAQEAPSPRMYSHMMLEKLLPKYKPAVLALKAGGQLKDAAKIDWVAVIAFMNSHEREEVRQGGENAWANAATRGWTPNGSGAGAKPAWKPAAQNGSGVSEQRERRPLSSVECYNCHEYGHYKSDCTKPKQPRRNDGANSGGYSGGRSRESDGQQQRSRNENAAAAIVSSNHYHSLSEDEQDDADNSGNGRANTVTTVVASGATDCAMAGMTYAAAASSSASAAKPRKLLTLREKEEQEKRKKDSEKKPESAKPAAVKKSAPAAAPAPVAPAPPKKSAVQLDALLSKDAYGWDTMASVHVSGNRAQFSSLRKCTAVAVKTADGNIVTGTQCGTVHLRVTTDDGRNIRLSIENVLFNERFTSNLLSGEKLTQHEGWEYHSKKNRTYVITPGGNKVPLSTEGRIAVILGAGPERVYAALIPGGGIRDDNPNVSALMRLHVRLSHMGFDEMIRLIRSQRVTGLGDINLTPAVIQRAREHVRECRACFLGKQARTSFDHRGLTPGKAPLEILHMDSYVVKCPGRDGLPSISYGITIKDTYSGEGSYVCVRSKDLVAQAVIDMLTRMETSWNSKVKRINVDGGSEFINGTLKSWMDKKGIAPRISPKETQALNGVAERSVRSFKDLARTQLMHARAPFWMWDKAMHHTIWMWNRIRISNPNGKSVYEQCTGRLPSVTEKLIGVWGCDAYVHVRKEHRAGAMAAKAEPAIYLGHDPTYNAPLVLLLSNKKLTTTRDIKFLNGSFSHMRALVAGEDAIAAILDGAGDSFVSEEDSSGSMPDGFQAQGGRLPSSPDDYTESKTDAPTGDPNNANSDPDEWTVESIVDRRVIRGRNPQYKVRWAGYTAADDTWMDESEVNDLAALDTYLKDHPSRQEAMQQTERRRSPREHDSSAALDSAEHHADDREHSRVEMAMMTVMEAICDRRTSDEGFDDIEAVCSAVSDGIGLIRNHSPKNLREALASKDASKWNEARQKEYLSMKEKQVWDEVPRSSVPPGARILRVREVFKLKENEQGEVIQHKARFTVDGSGQKIGRDCGEVYARTGKYKTERFALSMCARLNSELKQFDVPVAFLNADVEEEVYMEIPSGFGEPGTVAKLKKSLYGLKQAPRNWDKLIHSFIADTMKWKASVSDPSLYFKRSRTGRLMMIYRFVDDMQGQHHAEDEKEFGEASEQLRERFDIKQMETATWMLGMRITRDRKARTIKLDQELYITKALERFGLSNCKVAASPEHPGADTDMSEGMDAPCDRDLYMQKVGTCMYAGVASRLDTTHAIHKRASRMQDPRVRDMIAIDRILRYYAGTKDVGLIFGSRNGDSVGDSRGHGTEMLVDVCAYADADWANDKSDRKSISGWVAKINGDPISWSSKKQQVVGLSTCESELYAQAAAVQEVLWILGLCKELGLQVRTGSAVHCDNQSTIAVCKNGIKNGERTKHVDIKYHFITETMDRGEIKMQWVQSSEQEADIFTKALAAPVFLHLRAKLMSR
jgi:hypothetical protein